MVSLLCQGERSLQEQIHQLFQGWTWQGMLPKINLLCKFEVKIYWRIFFYLSALVRLAEFFEYFFTKAMRALEDSFIRFQHYGNTRHSIPKENCTRRSSKKWQVNRPCLTYGSMEIMWAVVMIQSHSTRPTSSFQWERMRHINISSNSISVEFSLVKMMRYSPLRRFVLPAAVSSIVGFRHVRQMRPFSATVVKAKRCVKQNNCGESFSNKTFDYGQETMRENFSMLVTWLSWKTLTQDSFDFFR